jgi:hypothetical protein
LAETGCQGQEGRTLVLTNAEHRSAQVGDACAWFDKLGPTSPDGQYLVAWTPTDGAASEIHLVALTASPADVVTVPHSNSVDYVATWTKDGRVWFTSDESPPSSINRLLSYGPVSHRQDSMPRQRHPHPLSSNALKPPGIGTLRAGRVNPSVDVPGGASERPTRRSGWRR